MNDAVKRLAEGILKLESVDTLDDHINRFIISFLQRKFSDQSMTLNQIVDRLKETRNEESSSANKTGEITRAINNVKENNTS